ncbi:DNAH3, partial [Symbiodinium necroappetens]
VFEAMKKLTFTSELSATQMVSKEGETIDFVSPVHTSGKNVETWMTEVENQMLAAVREVIKIGVESYIELDRTEWVLQQPGQVCLNSSQVHWTAEVEEAIGQAALSGYFEKLSDQLMGLVRLVRGDISKLQRMSIGALIVIDVHAKDTVEKMAKDNITDVFSFEWISQLRYYWEVSGKACYEYLGNSFRLVITPLTDMCYMTLMGAQSLNLGGAPAGPAGTLRKALRTWAGVLKCHKYAKIVAINGGMNTGTCRSYSNILTCCISTGTSKQK